MASRIGKQEAQLIELSEGAQAHLPPDAKLPIQATALAKARADAAAAKKAYQDALAARRAITVEARTFCKAFKVALKQHFGSQNPVLAAFGIPVDKPFVATPVQKALANARRARTRLLRGTHGPKASLARIARGTPPVAASPAYTLSEAVQLVSGSPTSPGSPSSEEEE